MQKVLLLVLVLALAATGWWLLAGAQLDLIPANATTTTQQPDPTTAAMPPSDATGARDRTPVQAKPARAVPTRLEVLVRLANGAAVGHRAVTVVGSDPRTPFFRHAVTDERGRARPSVAVRSR